jgi:N-acetyl-anhydromuramyl-L-alanine amidase AmpD
MPLQVKNKPLPPEEFVPEVTKKDTVYLHHTAGGHRPDWVVDGWMADRTATGSRSRVATAWVLGGSSTTLTDESWDGVAVRAFPDENWAFHLGVRNAPAGSLDRKSVGIEICSYGQLIRTPDGRFLNWVKKEVPASMAVDLGAPFRGFQFYQRYTNKQLAAVKELLLDIANRHAIDIRKGLPALLRKKATAAAFEFQADALAGKPGLWTHTNVRTDKVDCQPQQELIDLLVSL